MRARRRRRRRARSLHHGPLAFDWASLSRKFFEETGAAKYKNIKIIVEGANNFDPNTARTLIKSLVQAHPDVNVIDADLGAEGVIAGLKDLGKTPGNDVLVTSGAISNQGKGLIASGEMFGSTWLMPVTEAETAAKFLIMAARREKIAQPDFEVCGAYAKTWVKPIEMANIDEFKPQW